MAVASKLHKTLPELYAGIGGSREIDEWLIFFGLQNETKEDRAKKIHERKMKKLPLNERIKKQFNAYNLRNSK